MSETKLKIENGELKMNQLLRKPKNNQDSYLFY